VDLATILETPNWVRKCPDETGACKSNIEDSCLELAQHDRAVFDEWSKKLIKAYYDTTGDYPKVYSYDDYVREWDLV
jgi:hypothetical protein